jgi:hypothetical protein
MHREGGGGGGGGAGYSESVKVGKSDRNSGMRAIIREPVNK